MTNVIINNKINFNEYIIHKKFIAGICLTANEVKDILRGACSLRGAYAYMLENKMQIIKLYIHCTNYSPRLLLLNKREIKSLISEFINGRILIPSVVFKINNLIKLELVLCTKQKKYLTKKINKLRELDLKEARRYNIYKIKI